MTAAYFISAFLMMNATPSLGWIQYTERYNDIGNCKEVIIFQKDELSLVIASQLGEKFVKILDFDCITYQEAVNRNTKLGH